MIQSTPHLLGIPFQIRSKIIHDIASSEEYYVQVALKDCSAPGFDTVSLYISFWNANLMLACRKLYQESKHLFLSSVQHSHDKDEVTMFPYHRQPTAIRVTQVKASSNYPFELSTTRFPQLREVYVKDSEILPTLLLSRDASETRQQFKAAIHMTDEVYLSKARERLLATPWVRHLFEQPDRQYKIKHYVKVVAQCGYRLVSIQPSEIRLTADFLSTRHSSMT
jgi:hypothetical protein